MSLKFILPLFSYLLGSIPFGLLIARLVKKIDIRNFGSGNIGATNVSRVIGKRWGILVFSLDYLKAFFPIFFMKFFLKSAHEYGFVFVLMACASVLGHNWPIFLKFKGGKGVATSAGAMSGLGLVFPKLWIVVLCSVAVWFLVFSLSRYVSLASLLAGIFFLIFSIFLLNEIYLKILSIVLVSLIIVRHKKNIKNLISHKENRF